VGGDAPPDGGGGGGGYFGGGGGNGFYGAGGGAGSSYWISSATTTSMSMDTTGTPIVQITPVFPGATEQLTKLLAAVTGVAPGTSLADKVKQTQGYVAANNKASACDTLGAFINEVKAQTNKKLTPAQAASFIAQANSIKATLGC